MNIKRIIGFLSIISILSASVLFGATGLLVTAPGETYTPGQPKSGTPDLQTSGVPFVITVYSYDNATYQPVTTNASVNLSSSQTASFSPNPATLSIDEPVQDSKQYVTVTVGSAVSGDVGIYANTGGGILPTSVTITAQNISSFSFAAVSNQVAGTQFSYTITAITSGGATVTSFNGSASLTAVYSTSGTVNLGTVNFSGGIAAGNTTLYKATAGESLVLRCSSTVPAASGDSNLFNVNPNTLDRLLVIGPGQTGEFGTQTGNGRAGGSTTTTQQTAGAPFSVTVYACDAYWNTLNASSGTVVMSSDDPDMTFDPASPSLASGRAVINVTLRTVGSGTRSITASRSGGGATANSDNVPLTHGALDHFAFTQTVSNRTAGQLFYIYAAARDAYSNTVTSFTQAVSLDCYAGGTPVNAANWFKAPTSPQFTNGILDLTAVRVYQRLFNATLRLSYGAITGDSNTFTVSPAAFSKLLVLAPGESHDPGNNTTGGKTGSPSIQSVGATVPMNVYATDQYGNQISSVNDAVRITATDSSGTANGVTVPADISLADGAAQFNFIFRTSGNQTITAADLDTAGITNGTTSVVVQASSITYFEIANLSSPQTAGGSASPVIRARDQYGNLVTGWTGSVWITSPDTDWTLPFESTINITSGNSQLVGHRWHVTFTASDNGQRTLSMSFRRAAASARLFVTTVEDDTIDAPTGIHGISGNIVINHGALNRMQVLPPGMDARPGTADGEHGVPTGQSANSPFYVTVNAVDAWYNVITAGTGSTHTISLTTNDPTNSLASRVGQALVTPPVQGFLVAGTTIMVVQYNNESSSFFITASNTSSGGITPDDSPTINIFNIIDFTILTPAGAQIPDQVAGEAFAVSITAYSGIGVVATGFNGTVELRSSNNYSDSEYTISPTQSVTFTAGVCVMNVTLYRASSTIPGTGGMVTLKAKFGNTEQQSNSFNLWPGAVSSVLVIADGMIHRPGLAHVGIPGYRGYEGSPKTNEAGIGFSLRVLYLDDNYNQVFTLPERHARLTSTDPIASVDGLTLATNNVYVTITAGAFYTPSGMVLRTVGDNGFQTITAEPGSPLANNTTPPISMRHTTHTHFGILVPPGEQVAGVPFNITIQALDAFQNVCDNRNGGLPFNSTAELSASTGSNTMFPLQYTLNNGEAVASVRLFKAPETTVRITASYAGITGTCDTDIQTISNEFKRLLVVEPGGMSRNNGVFTGTTPVNFPMYSGAPFWPAGAVVNDESHTPAGYDFIIYACDSYGNVTATPDLAGQTVIVTTSDAYATPVTPAAISTVTGQENILVRFHTAQTGNWVSATMNNPEITDFTTNTFTTLAGDPYGLQILIPGLYAANGSGRTSSGGSLWYNGVTGLASTQVSGVYFPVTVQASDIFGNFVNSPTNTIRLQSTAPDPSFPRVGDPFVGDLGSGGDPGKITTTARFVVNASQYVNMEVQDINPGNLQRTYETPVQVYVVLGGQLDYQLIVNGVYYGDGTNSTTAVAYPDTFALTLNVIDTVSNSPVFGANNLFQFDAVLASDLNTLAGGTLAIQNGNVSNGVFTTINQSYTGARSIRIRVSDPDSVLATRYSPVIHVSANANSISAFTLTAEPPNIRAGNISNMTARVVDAGENPVIGEPVFFEVISGVFLDPGSKVSDNESVYFNGLNTFTAYTDGQGIAVAPFTGSYINETCVIRAVYYGNQTEMAEADVSISLSEPSAGVVSNYPNPFRAGEQPTYISYLLTEDTDVSIKIYTLFGDLVLTRDFRRGEEGAVPNVVNIFEWDGRNDRGIVVGNGGYICVVEAVVNGAKQKMIRKIAVAK